MWVCLGCYCIAHCITVEGQEEGREGFSFMGRRAWLAVQVAECEQRVWTPLCSSSQGCAASVSRGWLVSRLQVKHALFGTLLLLI